MQVQGNYPVNLMLDIGIPVQHIQGKTIHNFITLINSSLLDRKEADMLVLHYKEKWTYNKIAGKYELSKSRVQDIIGKAKRTLVRYKENVIFDENYIDERRELRLKIKHLEEIIKRNPSLLEEVSLEPEPYLLHSGLGLPERVCNLLARNHIRTLSELQQKSEYRLLQMRGIGRATVEEIKTVLNRNGLELSKPITH